MVSELAQESFRWEREQYKAALTAANERIRMLTEAEALMRRNAQEWKDSYTGERAVSDRLLEACRSIRWVGGRIETSDVPAFFKVIAEVEALRKGKPE